MRNAGSLVATVGMLVILFGPTPLKADEPDGISFFERKIRPVLVKECYSCHSSQAKRIKGGLRLDSRGGLLKGGDSGPALVPGKPDESRLLNALRYDGIEMPPRSKLPDEVIADLTSRNG